MRDTPGALNPVFCTRPMNRCSVMGARVEAADSARAGERPASAPLGEHRLRGRGLRASRLLCGEPRAGSSGGVGTAASRPRGEGEFHLDRIDQEWQPPGGRHVPVVLLLERLATGYEGEDRVGKSVAAGTAEQAAGL